MLSPGDINTKRFEKSAFGYRVDDVDGYLIAVAEEYAKLLHDNNELENKIVVLADRLEEYRNEEGSLSAALLGAQKMSDSLLREAKEKAVQIINEANGRAQQIIETSQKQVQRERGELLRVQREISAFKGNLLSMYKSQMDMIKSLPDANRSRPEQETYPQRDEKPSRFVYDDVQDVNLKEAKEIAAPQPAQPSDDIRPVPTNEPVFNKDNKKPETSEPVREDRKPENANKQPPAANTGTAPRGFVPNLGDEDIANDGYESPYQPYPPRPSRLPVNTDIPFENQNDDVPLAAEPTTSKFGELKFGAGYDLKRDNNYGMGKNSHKKR